MSNYIQKVHLAGVNCGRGAGLKQKLVVERGEFLQLPLHRRCSCCNGAVDDSNRAPYTPKTGKIIPFLNAVMEDRSRVFTLDEAAALMQVPKRGVMAMVAYALRAQVVFRGKDPSGATILRGSQFSGVDPYAHTRRVTPQSRKAKQSNWTPREGDIRIPRVVEGWAPPKMVAPRAGGAR